MKGTKWAALIAVCAVLACLLLRLVPKPAAIPPPSEMLLSASEGLDSIHIAAQLDPKERQLRVHHVLELTNRTGQDQNQLVLRTWPNAFQSMDTSPCTAEDELYSRYYPGGFSSGALVMSRASDGKDLRYRYLDDAKTVLSLPLSSSWEAGKTIRVELEYTVQPPRMANRFGVWNDVWALGNAFAVPAVWQDGTWRTDAYASVGDPFVSECANYTAEITLPEGWLCAGTGVQQAASAGDESTFSFSAPAVRDFALVLSPAFRTAQVLEGDVLITAYAKNVSHARRMLGYAQKALQLFEARYGTYPYQTFTLAEADFPAAGMEYPSLVMISSDMLQTGGLELEYTIVHETAHQWWYAAVGSDSWNQPWQDEALCEFSLLAYAESVYGAGEKEDLAYSRALSSLRTSVPQGVTPGSPLSAFSSMSEYSRVVYNRGLACLLALEETAGGLDTFLRDYYTSYAFSIASREDFEHTLAQSTGEDLTPLLRDYLDTSILN